MAAADSSADKLSCIDELAQKSEPLRKYYCACKGNKALTFESYTNHIFVCHNNVVPNGSSHELDGKLKKRRAQ